MARVVRSRTRAGFPPDFFSFFQLFPHFYNSPFNKQPRFFYFFRFVCTLVFIKFLNQGSAEIGYKLRFKCANCNSVYL